MPNSAKLFINPAGGYLLETEFANYLITDAFVIETIATSQGMEETNFNLEVQATIDNAHDMAHQAMSAGEIKVLKLLIQEKMEDFD